MVASKFFITTVHLFTYDLFIFILVCQTVSSVFITTFIFHNFIIAFLLTPPKQKLFPDNIFETILRSLEHNLAFFHRLEF